MRAASHMPGSCVSPCLMESSAGAGAVKMGHEAATRAPFIQLYSHPPHTAVQPHEPPQSVIRVPL